MSAIKNDPQGPLYREIQKLKPPWNHIFTSLKHMTLDILLDLIEQSDHLDICGVNVQGEQYTLETFASNASGSVSSVLYVLYGMGIVYTTGKLHKHLLSYAHESWMPRLFSMRFHNEPIFVSVCRREMRCVAEWMLGIMRKTKSFAPLFTKNHEGNTVLHIAVQKRQWEWSQWLIDQGCCPYQKNKKGKSSLMYAAPYTETISMFQKPCKEWYDALHDALVDGRQYPLWSQALIEAGADVNQPELLSSPVQSLLVFAQHGMDMNIGPAPRNISAKHYRVMYMYGKEPEEWSSVLQAFEEDSWVRFLHGYFKDESNENIPEEYRKNIISRQIITLTTQKIKESLN